MLKKLQEKYGEDFNWFEPLNKETFEKELVKELLSNHPLFGLPLKVVAKNERNDDVLFTDSKDYYLIHLTWSLASPNYPHYQKITQEMIQQSLEEDYLNN